MNRELLSSRVLMPKIQPILKTSISDDIVDQIMTLISRGDLKPGQRLPSERELCLRFGAGRSSLREALRCLSIVGVLNARVGEGTSVALDGGKFLGKILEWRLITEQHDIENLMEVRGGLESVSAAGAARSVTPQQLASLDSLLEKMKRCEDDHKRFAALDVDFHLAIAQASGNLLLLDMISMIRGQLAKALSRVLMLPTALPLSNKEHGRIVQCIRDHDPESASAAMVSHIKAGVGRYLAFTAMETSAAEARSAPTKIRVPRALSQIAKVRTVPRKAVKKVAR